MGGRGASLGASFDADKNGHFYIEKNIYGQTKLVEYKKLKGDLYYSREEGEKEWQGWGDDFKMVKSLIENTQKFKPINPKNLEKHKKLVKEKEKRRLNNERKREIRKRLNMVKNGKKVNYSNSRSNRANAGYETYKGGKRVVKSSYRLSRVKEEIAKAKGNLDWHASNISYDRKFTGRVKASDEKAVRHYTKKIKGLERQLMRV